MNFALNGGHQSRAQMSLVLLYYCYLFFPVCRRVFSIVLEIQYPSAAEREENDGSTTPPAAAAILQYTTTDVGRGIGG